MCACVCKCVCVCVSVRFASVFCKCLRLKAFFRQRNKPVKRCLRKVMAKTLCICVQVCVSRTVCVRARRAPTTHSANALANSAAVQSAPPRAHLQVCECARRVHCRSALLHSDSGAQAQKPPHLRHYRSRARR